MFALGVALAAPAAPGKPPETATAAPQASPEAIAAAFVAGDCNRCHTVPGVADATRVDSCTGCHVWIRAVAADPAKREKAMAVFPLWERYERNVATYLEVPSLDAAMARLEPEWVRAYLHDPYDLRPGLPETMPRFALTDAQIEAIVQGFQAARVQVPVSPAPSADALSTGERLFNTQGCAGCHAFGARHPGAVPLAPDLAHTRDRMHPDVVLAWIRDPKSVSAAATMPSLGLDETTALLLRDYVLLADPKWKPAQPLGPAPAATEARATWAQVEERVFGRICVHCHMNPELNQGRAGPGNGGGFGYAATGIELQTYEGVVAAKDLITDAILRRRTEGHRDFVHHGEQPAALTRPAKPGMPLGLPPLSDEDTALVLGWIAQGTPKE